MARLRLRLKINEGRIGAPLDKLAEIAKETERFLRMLGDDLKLKMEKGEWLARNFENGSVGFDADFQGDVPENIAHQYDTGLRHVASFDPDVSDRLPFVSDATILQYTKIGEILDPDERAKIGFYNGIDGAEPKEWAELSHRQAIRVKRGIEAPILAYASAQGIVHSWFKEAGFFWLRELSTQALVKCVYAPKQYEAVHKATQNKTAVLHVHGMGSYDRAKRAINELTVEDLSVASLLSEAEFASFFGIAPSLTGDMSTSEFIESQWDDADR